MEESKDFANSFFNAVNKDTETISNHDEWLLTEYSKLMHRECALKKREETLKKNDNTNNGKTSNNSQ